MAIASQTQQGTTSHNSHAAKGGLNHMPSRYKIMTDEAQRLDSPERAGSRNSFSSIREDDSDLAQTFTTSKVSSYSTPPADEAIVDDTTLAHTQDIDMTAPEFCPPVTQPSSRLHGSWIPANSFRGWKQISVHGKLASKSFGDLQGLSLAWQAASPPPVEAGMSRPGESLLEKLPVELLTAIIKLLVNDIPPNGVEKRNVDLMSMLLTSKRLHAATLDCLYQKITIPHSRIFQKFRTHIAAHPSLGTMVRRLDFCHFNPATLFTTATERFNARNLTSETLLECLDLTPNLQEFLVQEYIDEDLSRGVLSKLLFGLTRLEAVDFSGCTSDLFRDAFSAVVQEPDMPSVLTIKRLSMHRCLTLTAAVFDELLPRLPQLTHLDVTGTRITDTALWSIPETARITHLNLAKCKLLSAKKVIQFLAEHPAVTSSLVFLSLGTDARSHELLDENSLRELIPVLPKTLKSLSLKGSKMDVSHIKQLLPLTKHLEELALGRSLKLADVRALFLPDDQAELSESLEWVPHTVKYLDLSDMWASAVDNSELFNTSVLLKSYSRPLTVIEFSESVFNRVRKSEGALARAGWRVSETGGRSWLVRVENGADDGWREWKMGARYWGMRKIPVARAEVGGMYGNFMFGRKL